ncbi:hypothetical protein C8R42DRAFT_649327 [Lentinula raphanica]|nr:hypothetical protein C8R42DRAFT_649327 [Lentinula raphanica]
MVIWSVSLLRVCCNIGQANSTQSSRYSRLTTRHEILHSGVTTYQASRKKWENFSKRSSTYGINCPGEKSEKQIEYLKDNALELLKNTSKEDMVLPSALGFVKTAHLSGTKPSHHSGLVAKVEADVRLEFLLQDLFAYLSCFENLWKSLRISGKPKLLGGVSRLSGPKHIPSTVFNFREKKAFNESQVCYLSTFSNIYNVSKDLLQYKSGAVHFHVSIPDEYMPRAQRDGPLPQV